VTIGITLASLIYAATMLLYLTQQRSIQLKRSNNVLTREVNRRTRVEAEVHELNRDLKEKSRTFKRCSRSLPLGLRFRTIPSAKRSG
jgi:hypothetical protein